MYKIYVDNELFCDSSINELVVMNPVVTLEANTAGQFTFTIPVTHPYYDSINRLTSVVKVYRENKMVFRGFVSGDEKDLWNNRSITCEGDLSYLNDSILRPHKWQRETVSSLLTAYIDGIHHNPPRIDDFDGHNDQVEERKKFSIGVVTVTDPNDYIYCFTNMNNTMTEIKEDLIDDLGGYLRVRYSSCQDLFSLVPFQVRTVHNNRAYAGLFNLKPNTAYTISLESPSGTGSTVYFNSLDRSVEGQGGTQTITTDSTGIVWVWILEGRTATDNYLNGTYPIHLVEGTEAYGKTYLDYISEEDFPIANQIIELGVNLINYKSNIDDIDLCTRVIPLGALLKEQTIEGLDTRLTIFGQPVSSTHLHTTDDYLESTSAVNNFGIITKTVTFDDVTTPSKLATKGNKYLSQNQFENLVIEVSAVDLGLIDSDVDTWDLLQKIRVKSEVHGLDAYFPLTKMVLNLANPENDTFTLGTKSKLKTSLTAKTSEASEATKRLVDSMNQPAWLAQAQQNALNMLLDETQGGHVVLEYHMDNNNQPEYVEAISVCNATTIESSTKRWRWSQNGFGYMERSNTSSSWGTLKTAMTADGKINADRILAGVITGREINNGNGTFHVHENGAVTASDMSITGGNIDISAERYDQAKIMTHYQYGVSSINYKSALTPQGLYVMDDGNFSSDGTSFVHAGYFAVVGSAPGIEIVNLHGGYNGYRGMLTLKNTSNEEHITITEQEIAAYSDHYEQSYSRISSSYIHTDGDLSVAGTKSRVVKTPHYGQVLLNAYETPKPTFADEGHGKLDEKGVCYIYLDDVFLETIDQTHRYRVFLTKYSQGDIWVSEISKEYFMVSGTPDMEFDWKIDCIQRDYNNYHMEKFEDKENEEIVDYNTEADKYLKQYEREVLTDESNY